MRTNVSQCSRNLNHLGLALLNYHDTYNAYPPPITCDEQGRPMHSWRWRIAPFIEKRPSSDPLHFYRESEPWNSPNNLRLAERMSLVMSCPAQSDARYTDYFMVYGGDSPFQADQAVRARDLSHPSSTIFLAESSGLDIVWTEPRDLDARGAALGIARQGGFINSPHSAGANVVMADGSLRCLPFETTPEALQAMIRGAP